MKLVIYLTIFLGAMTAKASDCSSCACSPKDDHEKLGRACERAFHLTEARIDCLASARLLATIDFCSRQHSKQTSRLECIIKVDGAKAK